jgi:cytoskeletal protein RodZ
MSGSGLAVSVVRVRRLRWIALAAIVGLVAWWGWRRFTETNAQTDARPSAIPETSSPAITGQPTEQIPSAPVVESAQTSVRKSTQASTKKSSGQKSADKPAKKTSGQKSAKKTAKKTTKKAASTKAAKTSQGKSQGKSTDDGASSR